MLGLPEKNPAVLQFFPVGCRSCTAPLIPPSPSPGLTVHVASKLREVRSQLTKKQCLLSSWLPMLCPKSWISIRELRGWRWSGLSEPEQTSHLLCPSRSFLLRLCRFSFSGASALTRWLPRLVVDYVACLMVVPSLVPVNQVLWFHLYCVVWPSCTATSWFHGFCGHPVVPVYLWHALLQ